MKAEIHPAFHADAKVHCACGAVFSIPGTQKEMHVEICSQCHPFYTGNNRIVDTEGRVEKFRKRFKIEKK